MMTSLTEQDPELMITSPTEIPGLELELSGDALVINDSVELPTQFLKPGQDLFKDSTTVTLTSCLGRVPTPAEQKHCDKNDDIHLEAVVDRQLAQVNTPIKAESAPRVASDSPCERPSTKEGKKSARKDQTISSSVNEHESECPKVYFAFRKTPSNERTRIKVAMNAAARHSELCQKLAHIFEVMVADKSSDSFEDKLSNFLNASSSLVATRSHARKLTFSPTAEVPEVPGSTTSTPPKVISGRPVARPANVKSPKACEDSASDSDEQRSDSDSSSHSDDDDKQPEAKKPKAKKPTAKKPKAVPAKSVFQKYALVKMPVRLRESLQGFMRKNIALGPEMAQGKMWKCTLLNGIPSFFLFFSFFLSCFLAFLLSCFLAFLFYFFISKYYKAVHTYYRAR
jgi:hypothetical protein